MKRFSLLAILLSTTSAFGYIAGPGAKGRLRDLAQVSVTCMDSKTREINRMVGQIGPGNYLGVIGDVNTFTVVSIDPRQQMVSLSSPDLDASTKSMCRIDITEDELAAKTMLTDYDSKF